MSGKLRVALSRPFSHRRGGAKNLKKYPRRGEFSGFVIVPGAGTKPSAGTVAGVPDLLAEFNRDSLLQQ